MKNFKLFSFTAILFMLCFYSCSVDLIEPNKDDSLVDNRIDEDCQFFITGQVLDARDRMEIADARIFSEDLDVDIFSDGDGRYLFNVPFPIDDFFGSRRLIEVTKDGYVLSTLEIDFKDFYFEDQGCEESYTEVEIDFVLTKKQACHTIDSDASSFLLYDTVIVSQATNTSPVPLIDFTELGRDTVVREFRVNVAPGTVEEATDICITPISDDQYLGLLEDLDDPINDNNQDFGTPIMRFDFSPDGLTFANDISISFKTVANEVNEGDELVYYIRNEATNRWELDPTATVEFDAASSQVTLLTNHFSQGLILNISTRIEIEDIFYSAPSIVLVSNSFNTCNCLDSLNVEYSDEFEHIDEEFSLETSTSNQRVLLQKLQALKTILNIGASQSSNNLEYLAANSLIDFPTVRVYEEREIEVEGKIFKCELTVITVSLQHKVIEGRFGDIPFSYRSFAGIIVESPELPCHISTLCHQGCPE